MCQCQCITDWTDVHTDIGLIMAELYVFVCQHSIIITLITCNIFIVAAIERYFKSRKEQSHRIRTGKAELHKVTSTRYQRRRRVRAYCAEYTSFLKYNQINMRVYESNIYYIDLTRVRPVDWVRKKRDSDEFLINAVNEFITYQLNHHQYHILCIQHIIYWCFCMRPCLF